MAPAVLLAYFYITHNAKHAHMRTSIELPEDLLHRLRLRARREGRRLTDLVADLLKAGLGEKASGSVYEVGEDGLPVIRCGKNAGAGREVTPERVAEILWGAADCNEHSS
jgi:plasmid stability protein